MVVRRKFVYVKKYEGLPKESDYKLIEETLPPLKEGEYLVEAKFISVDPYQRAYEHLIVVGGVPFGGQVGQIIESKHKDFPVGKYVFGQYGWQTHTIASGADKDKLELGFLKTYILPDFGNLPLSLGLGVLGMPGNTAYFGLLEITHPKAGETLVVSGAAGACGSIVGQIGKIKGLRVVGITGSDEKAKWLIDHLGFDATVNYKKGDLEEQLQKAAPKGIDVYFDNVGGEISSTVLSKMNSRGRVAVCGAISSYNDTDRSKATVVQIWLVLHELKVEGFQVIRWNDRWLEGINQNLRWIKEGKLKYEETVTEGFGNVPKAFISMLQGGNKGKAVIKV